MLQNKFQAAMSLIASFSINNNIEKHMHFQIPNSSSYDRAFVTVGDDMLLPDDPEIDGRAYCSNSGCGSITQLFEKNTTHNCFAKRSYRRLNIA
jgi:hypothetical protein